MMNARAQEAQVEIDKKAKEIADALEKMQNALQTLEQIKDDVKDFQDNQDAVAESQGGQGA